MTRFTEDLKVIVAELKKQREELALQAHLATAEFKQEWDIVERKWETFHFKAEKVLHELKDVSGDVEEDLKLLSDDLKEHYAKIKHIAE